MTNKTSKYILNEIKSQSKKKKKTKAKAKSRFPWIEANVNLFDRGLPPKLVAIQLYSNLPLNPVHYLTISSVLLLLYIIALLLTIFLIQSIHLVIRN